jgi:hypothetical protein
MKTITIDMPADLNSIEEIEFLAGYLQKFGVSVSLVTGTDRDGISWRIGWVNTPLGDIMQEVVAKLTDSEQTPRT